MLHSDDDDDDNFFPKHTRLLIRVNFPDKIMSKQPIVHQVLSFLHELWFQCFVSITGIHN